MKMQLLLDSAREIPTVLGFEILRVADDRMADVGGVRPQLMRAPGNRPHGEPRELLPGSLDRLESLFLQRVEQTGIDQLDAFRVFLIGRFVLERAFEVVENRQQAPNHLAGRELNELGPVALGAPARIVEFGAGPEKPVFQIGLLGSKTIAVGADGRQLARFRGLGLLGRNGRCLGIDVLTIHSNSNLADGRGRPVRR